MSVYNKRGVTMNMNEFSRDITLQEGGKKSLDIGQVKEVIRLTLIKLGKMDDKEIIKIINRYRK